MPKLKTSSAAAKRFKLTKSGKVKRTCAFGNHILTKKSKKRKRKYRKGDVVSSGEVRMVKKLCPYL